MAGQHNPERPILAEAVDERPTRNSRSLWVASTILCVLFATALVVPYIDERAPPYGDATSAYAISKQYVEDRLESPASATFPWSADEAEYVPRGRWIVRGHVDSQNTYGTMIRHHFRCEVTTRDGSYWNLADLELRP